MQTTSEILAGLGEIANRAFAIAVIWHLLLAGGLVGLAAGWRPSARWTATATAAPLASVSALAWIHGNPFNGSVFAALALVIAWLGARAPRAPVALGDRWRLAEGVLLLGYAWAYPHFLADRSAVAYLYGAPMGLIPCPSLALAIGLALVTGVPGGRAWGMVLAGGAAFYALFGILRLGVWLDLGLLVGALALAAHAIGPRWSPRGSRRRPATSGTSFAAR